MARQGLRFRFAETACGIEDETARSSGRVTVRPVSALVLEAKGPRTMPVAYPARIRLFRAVVKQSIGGEQALKPYAGALHP